MKKTEPFTDTDVALLKNALRTISLASASNELGGYRSPAVICIDAVLSINRRYYSFVVPRVKQFMEEYPDVKSLGQMKKLIQQKGEPDFFSCLRLSSSVRSHLLAELVEKMRQIADDSSADEMTALRDWAQSTSPYQYKDFGVSHVGIATFQYLRILLGAETVKPDRHIMAKVSDTIKNKSFSPLNAILLFEKACADLQISTKQMEHTIWINSQCSSKDPPYIWVDDHWEDRS